jgi:hypothetical protein
MEVSGQPQATAFFTAKMESLDNPDWVWPKTGTYAVAKSKYE